MSSEIKIKAKAKATNGLVKVKILIKHPMETGRRKDEAGVLVPIHHLQEVTVKYKDEAVFRAEFGTGVSRDPFLSFVFKGESKQALNISVIDSKGFVGKTTIVIK